VNLALVSVIAARLCFFPLAIAAFVCAIKQPQRRRQSLPTIRSLLVRPQIFCTAGEKTRVNCALCILRTAGCGSHHYFAIERYVIAQFRWFVCVETQNKSLASVLSSVQSLCCMFSSAQFVRGEHHLAQTHAQNKSKLSQTQIERLKV
jgi:hypothetical protein